MQGGREEDSHELLRLLLDGLQTEELKAIRAKAGGSRHREEVGSLLWLSSQ